MLKPFIGTLYHMSPAFVRFLINVKHYLKYGGYGTFDKWPTKSLMKFQMDDFEKKHGYRFDINHPKTFTEKIQWNLLYYNHPDMARITNKVTFKAYIDEKLGPGHVVPMYAAWDNLEDMERDWFTEGKLPDTFILKANLQCDGNCIKVIKNKKDINFKQLKKELGEWLKLENTLMDSTAHRFYKGTPMIIAEEFLASISHQLYDYKIFCFDGVPRCFYVQTDCKNSKITFYDLDWNMIDVKYGSHERCEIPKPKHFDEMLEIAKKLSVGFPFIRVDFFETEETLYMAELTFNPGWGLTPYQPKSFDEELGKYFNVPC